MPAGKWGCASGLHGPFSVHACLYGECGVWLVGARHPFHWAGLWRVQWDSPYAFPHCFGMCSCFSHFSLIIHHLHSCALAIFKWNTCVRRALLLVLLLILLMPWLVYAYDPDGFAQERPIGRNKNVIGYPFPDDTRVVSSLSFLFSFLCILASQHLF